MRQFTWSQQRHTKLKLAEKQKTKKKIPAEMQLSLQSHMSFCTTIAVSWAQFRRYHSWPSNTSPALAGFNSSRTHEDPWSFPKIQVSERSIFASAVLLFISLTEWE